MNHRHEDDWYKNSSYAWSEGCKKKNFSQHPPHAFQMSTSQTVTADKLCFPALLDDTLFREAFKAFLGHTDDATALAAFDFMTRVEQLQRLRSMDNAQKRVDSIIADFSLLTDDGSS
jgi:hypothetical protein